MRISSLNLENLFSRAKAMNENTWSEGKPILTEYSRLSVLLQNDPYSKSDQKAILASLKKLGLAKSDDAKFVRLRQNRERLLKRPKNGPPEIVATGRSDWVGWIELKDEAVNEISTRMTAQVIKDVDADILAVVEAEDRIALTRFNEQLLAPIGAAYDSLMLIDGNDERGIDVGIMTKSKFSITSMVSHVDDKSGSERIFSRDCPEYQVETTGASLRILVNHFKSKGYGTPAVSNAKRRLQAQRVRDIYEQRKADGIDRIAILGDFNDTPDSDPLEPLLGQNSDLRDITQHPKFVSDGRPGTFKNGTASGKIDYVLLSPALFARVTGGQIFRKGVWGGIHGTLFPHYDEMTEPVHAASDHAAIYADIEP